MPPALFSWHFVLALDFLNHMHHDSLHCDPPAQSRMGLEWGDLTGIGSLLTSASSITCSLPPGLSEGYGFVGLRSTDVTKLGWKELDRATLVTVLFVINRIILLTCDIYEHFKKWWFGEHPTTLVHSLYRGNVANSAERDSKLTKIYLCIKRSDRQHNTKAWFSNALLSLSYTNPSYLLRWETIRCLILVSVFCHIALGPHVRIGTWASGIFHTRFVAQIFWSSGKSGDRESRNCIYMYPFARKIAKGLEP